MWGCFCRHDIRRMYKSVFPTHVGVFLVELLGYPVQHCLPHACGGVSIVTIAHAVPVTSSPRMWGCFSRSTGTGASFLVFPTHVGVFLKCFIAESESGRLPHACGGVSLLFCISASRPKSSPRMWGCFQFVHPSWRLLPVFPTHVGAIFKPYNLPTPRLPCSRPYPARTAGRAGPANAGFGKALSNHPATGNPPRRSCGKSGAWAAWLQTLPVPAFRAGVEASLPAWAARRALLPLRPAPHVGR